MALGRKVEWLVTSNCDHNCLHCCYSDFKKERELGLKNCFKFIDSLAMLGIKTLVFSGGEPFLKEKFKEILIHTRDNGIEIHIETSGLFSFKEIELIKSIGAALNVSLDGSDAKVHDRFRGRDGSFKRALACIQLLNKNSIPFTVITVLNKMNYKNIFDIYQLLKEEGVKSWIVTPVKWRGSAVDNHSKLFIPEELEDMLLFKILKMEEKEKCLSIKSVFNRKFLTQDFPAIKYACEVDRFSCSCHVTPSGRVFGCIWLPKMTYMGNLEEESFEEIWSSLDNIKLFKVPIDELRICKNCKYKAICGGGCRAEALRLTGDILGPDMTACRRIRLLHRYTSENYLEYSDKFIDSQ